MCVTEMKNDNSKPSLATEIGVEPFLVGPLPDRCKHKDDLTWMVAGLKQTIFISDDGIHLIPLSGEKTQCGFNYRLLDAWNNQELRQGYLPTLPRDFPSINKVVKNWAANDRTVIYRICQEPMFGTDCYLRVDFEQQETDLTCWIAYGNLQPNKLRKGLMTNGLRLFIEGIKKEVGIYGFKLKKIITDVSESNVGSLKVLQNNGFIYDQSRQCSDSSILMGGKDIPVVLNIEQ